MGHSIAAYEPADSWSRKNLIADQGKTAVSDFHAVFPGFEVHTYNGIEDIPSALHGAELAIVHEWTDPAIVTAIGRHASSTPGLTLLFHDTHHRAVSDPAAMRAYDLSAYDGILAFGQSLADKYARQGWGSRAFVLHEAADTALFHPASIPISDRRRRHLDRQLGRRGAHPRNRNLSPAPSARCWPQPRRPRRPLPR